MRPIRGADVDLDMPAVMGSRERLWSRYGAAWGWPPATLTREQDQEDLQHHEDEIEAHGSFNYALFDRDETELIVMCTSTLRPRGKRMPRSTGGYGMSMSAQP